MIPGDREFKLLTIRRGLNEMRSKLASPKAPKYNKYVKRFGLDLMKVLEDMEELLIDLIDEP